MSGTRLEPLAGLAHAEERQRDARRDAGGGQDLGLGQLAAMPEIVTCSMPRPTARAST